jgi:GTP-binding protein LepA
MDLERERGITIKLKPIRMNYRGFVLNLIDTPGHVDFSYEVSRSLAAVEGALMIVDATQGVEAQTVANLYQAIDQGLTIIPVLNKIDLPNAQVETVRQEVAKLIGIDPATILAVSAKTGEGVSAILDRIIEAIPPPKGDPTAKSRALIFDSQFDDYRGVVASVRVVDGTFRVGQDVLHVATGESAKILELGTFGERFHPAQELQPGEIGYIVGGLRDIHLASVGDTITDTQSPAEALPGYRTLTPMVFAALYPQSGDEYPKLRESLLKLKLNDSALSFEPEQSPALGHGYRCGFLGMLHLEIVEQRLQREFDLQVIVTVPSVGYRAQLTSGEMVGVSSPLDLPDPAQLEHIEEPIMDVTVVSPSRFVGGIMQACTDSRGRYRTTEYLDADRVVLRYEIPLVSLLVDFHDTLKSVSQGYASMQYDFLRYEATDVVRLDIRVADDLVEALSTIIYRDEAYAAGRRLVDRLKDILPRQQFEVKIQAAIGGQVIASSRISALRKDVTAKLYGGDVTRKRKLLEKQKKGKKRMKASGRIAVPPSAFSSLLRRR